MSWRDRCVTRLIYVLLFEQKTAYERRISDWSSDVCSSDLEADAAAIGQGLFGDAAGGIVGKCRLATDGIGDAAQKPGLGAGCGIEIRELCTARLAAAADTISLGRPRPS